MANQVIDFAADVPQKLRVSPFLPDQKAILSSPGTPDVYSVQHLGTDDDDYFQTDLAGMASSTTITNAEFTNLANAHDDAAGVLATADNLRVVVLVDGAIQTRVSSGGAPGAGEFTVDMSGTPTITLGTAVTAGQKVEVFVYAAADITQETGGTLVAARPYEISCGDFMIASAAAHLERLLR